MADRYVIFILIFLIPALAWAQNETRSQNEPLAQDEEPQFVQTLSWIGDEHVLRYEVIIEKENEGEVLRKFTETSFIEVSLPPGLYQYDVIPYDVLGRPSSSLGWQPLIIFTALQPELDNFSPRSFSLETDKTWTLNISGKKLSAKAEIYLRNLDDEDAAPIVPLETAIINDGNNARLVFNSSQFVMGNYEIHVANPGGLEANMAGLEVKQKIIPSLKDARILLGVAWMPAIPLNGKEDFDEQSAYPYGMAGRLAYIIPDQGLFKVGIELATSGYHFGTSSIGGYNTQTIDYNLLMQMRTRDETMAASSRLGLGLARSSVNGTVLHTNMGGSFLFMIQRFTYLETGFTVYVFPAKNTSAYLHPWIGIGLKI